MKSAMRAVFVILFAAFSLCTASNSSRSLIGHASNAGAPAAFMIISGISAAEEFCLSVENGNIGVDGAGMVLESCAGAVAAGDGRDLFSFQAGGQLLNVPGGKCAVLQSGDVTDGGKLVFGECDGASQWEVLGNGQLKLDSPGDFCLSQSGLAAGRADVAAKAAVSASSTANAIAHGAAMAVDDSAATFWASKFDSSEPVEYVIDFGEVHKLASVELSWEFPAKAFTVSLSADGEHFTEAFATDANVLKYSKVSLGSAPARKLRIAMHEPHPTHARLQGHLLYGIRSVAVYADRLSAIVSGCAQASKSSDARDKYFLSYVGESDPFPAKSLRSELPALESAEVSLATTASELADVLPRLGLCRTETMPTSITGMAKQSHSSSFITNVAASFASKSIGAPAGLVNEQNGLDVAALDLLLQEARASIIGVRKVLA